MKHEFTIYIEALNGGFNAWYYDGETGSKAHWAPDKKKAKKKALLTAERKACECKFVDLALGRR